VVVALVFCRLGWWQWDRARETHWNPQYLSYAMQWPLFAAFGIAMWVRIVRDAARPRADAAGRPGPRAAAVDAAVATEAAHVGGAHPAGRAGTAEQVGTAEPVGTAGQAGAGGEADEELAAYNRYLRWLDERDRQEQR
jgi:hypothetical protein